MTPRVYGIVRHLVWFALLLHVQAWMLVSKEGEITMVAPVDINPSYTYASVGFKSNSVKQWDITLDSANNLIFRYQETTDLLTVSTSSFSVSNVVSFGSGLSVYDFAQFGNTLSVAGATHLGFILSALDPVHFGSVLSIRSFVRPGDTLFVEGWTYSGEELSVKGRHHMGSSMFVRSFVRLDGGSLKRLHSKVSLLSVTSKTNTKNMTET